jgi:hypothetical protein
MSRIGQVSDDVKELFKDLAEITYSTLELAGLPVHYSSESSLLPGAEIGIDTGDDDAGGVYVLWRPSEQLSLAAAELVRRGAASDPTVNRSGSIKLLMKDTISVILESEGFSIDRSPNDMQPLAIRVMSAPRAADVMYKD